MSRVLRIEAALVMAEQAPRPDWGSVRALTEAMVRGDEEAFDLFYREYSPRVFRLVLVITAGDQELSAEVHQTVMIAAARKLKVLDTERDLWAWLAQVARNRCRDAWRRRAREQRARRELEAEEPRSAPASAELLEAALQSLSAPERELVESFYFDDLSQRQLARNSGRTVKAVEAALARIRRKIRRLLGQEMK